MIKGADHEINFWKGFVKTERFLNGWVGKEKTPELNDIVYDFIKLNLPYGGKVLDCGSGVCSILNGTVPNKDLMVTDLLGAEYAKIFDYKKHDIVQPIPLGCEDLPYRDQFDIVHISNAIDHTIDPVKSYHKLLEAVKKDGYLIVQGFENEGIHERWMGMHKWNISLTNTKQLRIEHESGKVDYIEGATIAERINVEMLGRDWIIFIVKK
jgi:SAM-dependent methyltransferase